MRLSLLALLFVLCGTAPVAAQWTAGAYLGGAGTRASNIIFEQPGLQTELRLHDVHWDGRSFQTPLYYGFRGGRILGERFGVEAEFIHAKVYAETAREVFVEGREGGVDVIPGQRPMSDIMERFSISHGVNFLLGNVVVRSTEWRGRGEGEGPRLILSGRAGAGGTISHAESLVQGVFQEGYESGGFAFQVAGGLEVRLWRGLFALGEAKFTRTTQNVSVHQGTVTAPLRSTHGIFGFSYYF